jgi:uncharacterized protein YjbI with pentapeptide repeats
MLDVSGFVFVLALNQQITEKAVESHYPREYGISGRDYLKKLVQVEFHLPPLRLQDVQEYALALQVKLGQTSGEVQRLLAQVTPLVAGDNPREVKRFINRTLVSTAIAQEAGVKVPIARQIAFMTASYRWPAFVEELRGEQDPRRDIGDYLKAKERGKALEDEGKRSRIEALLKQHEGLEFFLKEAPGSGLLLAKREELVQMLFYAALTQEKAPERPGRLSRDEVLAAVAEHRPLVGADLAGIDLSGAILIGADLRRSDLSMAILREAILSGADLRGANLTGANLTGAILTGAFLRGANLTGAILIRAFLTGAFLTGAFLTGAFLTEADLTGAFLREADLTEADLTEADLTRANLAGARGLMPEQAGKAIYDESTVWPEGFKPERGAG